MSKSDFWTDPKMGSGAFFPRELLLQMAVEWWEMNLETYSGYEKHSSGSEQYVSKKKLGSYDA